MPTHPDRGRKITSQSPDTSIKTTQHSTGAWPGRRNSIHDHVTTLEKIRQWCIDTKASGMAQSICTANLGVPFQKPMTRSKEIADCSLVSALGLLMYHDPRCFGSRYLTRTWLSRMTLQHQRVYSEHAKLSATYLLPPQAVQAKLQPMQTLSELLGSSFMLAVQDIVEAQHFGYETRRRTSFRC